MISLVAVVTALIVVNQVISLQTVLKRRSPGEVVAGERATSVEMKVINPETVRQSPVEEVGIVSTVVNPVICLRIVRRRGNQGEVVAVGLVMDVEKRVINHETVHQRLVEGVVVVALTVGKTGTSYVFFTFFST